MTPERRDIAVSELLRDRENPRLPEDPQGADQAGPLRYLNDEAVLEELIRSLNDNGFFEHEPLIAYDDEELEGFVVLEGNRRLAALKHGGSRLGEPGTLGGLGCVYLRDPDGHVVELQDRVPRKTSPEAPVPSR